MDFAYDQIAVRTSSNERSSTPKPSDDNTASDSTSTTSTRQPDRQNLQTEFQETFKAFSNSPWGTKLGGWWSTARTQGASYYETARKEAEKREAEAARALEEARRIVVERTKTVVEAAEEQLDNIVNEEKKAELQQQKQQQSRSQPTLDDAAQANAKPEDLSTTQQEDTETFLARFKSEAAKRLKEVQQAEDAADEALLRFGSNIRNFLKDTISVTAPEPSLTSNASEVLFESKDATTGKRVIHTSRFEAQLHVIHTTATSFTQDPGASEQEWDTFKKGFDIEKETDAIARDLEKYPELRNAMEKYVPEQVDYKNFWTRYYFLRYVVGMQEEKRKELLKASTIETEEEVAWDEESNSESEEPDKKTTAPAATTNPITQTISTTPAEPEITLPSHPRNDPDAMTLKAPRRSHDEKSVADSEASYDLVSGAASHAAGSPKQRKEEDSDDDWE